MEKNSPYLDDILLKKCCVCKKNYPPINKYFHKNSTRSDGLSHICKECTKIYKKKYYIKHKEEIKEHKRNIVLNIKKK